MSNMQRTMIFMAGVLCCNGIYGLVGSRSIYALFFALYALIFTWYWWYKKDPDFIDIVQHAINHGIKSGSKTMRDGTQYTFDHEDNSLTLVKVMPGGEKQRIHVRWEAIE